MDQILLVHNLPCEQLQEEPQLQLRHSQLHEQLHQQQEDIEGVKYLDIPDRSCTVVLFTALILCLSVFAVSHFILVTAIAPVVLLPCFVLHVVVLAVVLEFNKHLHSPRCNTADPLVASPKGLTRSAYIWTANIDNAWDTITSSPPAIPSPSPTSKKAKGCCPKRVTFEV